MVFVEGYSPVVFGIDEQGERGRRGINRPRRGVGKQRCAQRHAWCVDRGGRVIDSTPTWADPGRRLPNAMIGIALPLELARPHVECEEPTRGALSALSGRLEVVTDALGLERID